MVLIFISLIISDTVIFFMNLSIICIFPLEKCLFGSSAHVLSGFSLLLLLLNLSFLYNLDINPLSNT